MKTSKSYLENIRYHVISSLKFAWTIRANTPEQAIMIALEKALRKPISFFGEVTIKPKSHVRYIIVLEDLNIKAEATVSARAITPLSPYTPRPTFTDYIVTFVEAKVKE